MKSYNKSDVEQVGGSLTLEYCLKTFKKIEAAKKQPTKKPHKVARQLCIDLLNCAMKHKKDELKGCWLAIAAGS